MSFVSVAQATTRLGIDAKTLHRWLAEAQLPLHSCPQDGHKKGVSDEDLQALARRHQRSLTPPPPESPVPVASEGPALPERLDALQTQIAALQQRVTDLTRLLQQHQQEPAWRLLLC